MEPLFNEDKMIDRYRSILQSWEGTPYRHLAKVKGRGVDCTLLVGLTLKELGVLKKVDHEYYPRHWHMNTTKEWVIESFYHHIDNHLRGPYGLHWEQVKNNPSLSDMDGFIFGDVLTFSLTSMGVSNHCAIWIGNRRMFNSLHPRGCCYLTYGSYWKKRMTGLMRVYRK